MNSVPINLALNLANDTTARAISPQSAHRSTGGPPRRPRRHVLTKQAKGALSHLDTRACSHSPAMKT